MNLKKRVVVTIALVFLLIHVVYVLGEPSMNTLEYYTSFICTDSSDNPNNAVFWVEKSTSLPECNPDSDDELECGIKLDPNPSNVGCWVAAGDTANIHECISVKAEVGTTIEVNQYFKFIDSVSFLGGYFSRGSSALGGGLSSGFSGNDIP